MATTTPVPTSRIELRFKCTKLANLDVLSKSDPQIYVYEKRLIHKDYQLVGKTEKINNDLNPIFKTPVMIDYYFEETQDLRISVFDIDGEVFSSDDDDHIGDLNISLGNIAASQTRRIVKDIKNRKGKVTGSIEITFEEIAKTGHNLYLRLGGFNLDKKDFFGKSDPYYRVLKETVNGFVEVYKSEYIKNTLNPVWRETIIPLENLNGGDMKRPIQIQVYDYDSIGSHDLIGIFNTTMDEVLLGKKEFPLMNPKKTTKSNYKNSGYVSFYDARLVKDFSFLDYLYGGCEISLIVGIDCTGSNGEPTSSTSLHYKHPTKPNDYAQAIVSCGSVLTPYDSDGNIGVYGFGASLPNSYATDHCFPMTLTQNPEVLGVAGVLDTYYNNITKVSFSGPTYFAPLIDKVAKIAAKGQSQQNQKYTILMIITDGEITDIDNTIEAIVKASVLPLSIVIVGVGKDSFTNMVVLDGDDGLLVSNGVRAERDIVQFVPLRNYASNPQELASETLKEIPGQLLSYMKKMNYHPNTPKMPM
ncbi:hypothetical protein CYY_009678 [Polysphondylium violaceum]|uniref:C2 domain-containing protein n=1 Tax=Polysphondylium violaceum TaxID=133409 RepID=A0A8J4V0B6_9MYCE|nr:hypothetical protein CYY_009678 [Polysphondylium violaceum]